MSAYIKTFDVRWSDLDANRHLANTSYVAYMVHTRMSYFSDHGFTQEEFAKYQLGPAVIHEEIYYLHEIPPNDTVSVNIELGGRSADHRFQLWEHSLFNGEGRMAGYCKATVCWMDLSTRKVAHLPQTLKDLTDQMPKSDTYRILKKEDTWKQHLVPMRKLEI